MNVTLSVSPGTWRDDRDPDHHLRRHRQCAADGERARRRHGGARDAQLRRRPEAFPQVLLGKLEKHHPTTYDRIDTARFDLAQPLDLLQGGVVPTVRNTVVEFDDGKCAIALGDVHSIVDPMMGQGANVASYAAFVLGEEIVNADALDARLCEKIDLQAAGPRAGGLALDQRDAAAADGGAGHADRRDEPESRHWPTSSPRTSTIPTTSGTASRRRSVSRPGSNACRRHGAGQGNCVRPIDALPDRIYPAPKDAARFKAYYEATHVPLAKQLPGLKSCSFAYPEALGPATAPFCIFQAWFEDGAAMFAALQSEMGRKVASDVPNYSPDGATLFHFQPEHEMQGVNPAMFRQAASRFATGVAVVTALDGRGEVCGMTVNSFVSVSLFPPTVLISVKARKIHRRFPDAAATASTCCRKAARNSRDILRADRPRCAARLRNRGGLTTAVRLRRLLRLRGDARHRCQRPHAVHRRSIELRLLRHLPLVFFSSRYHLGPGIPVDR